MVLWAAIWGGLFCTFVAAEESQGEAAGYVLRIQIQDQAISPVTARFMARALREAEETRAGCLIIELNTPGGLLQSTQDVVTAILTSRVPVIVYVSPTGGRAASAGLFITLASHVAAMAPGTNLGAATPVPIGGSPPPERKPAPGDGEARDEEPPAAPEPAGASNRKAVNDAVAYIRSLAELRGRNVDWAEQAVRSAASLPAQEALEQNVVDLVARDVPDLLAQLDGRELEAAGLEVKLRTEGMVVERFEPDWRIELLSVITNPLVAYGLLIIGLYGLMFEGYNPGAVLPGVIGAICLLLGLYALQVLSVNYAGLALVGLGIAMMIAEVFVPSFGALGIGGLAAFVIGSIILMDTDAPGFGVHLGLVGGIATVAGMVMFGTVWMAMRARRKPVTTGSEQLVGAQAVAAGGFTGRGTVRIFGEEWNAESRVPVAPGQKVVIERVEGLTLHVRPAD